MSNMNVLLGGAIGDSLGMPFETRKAADPFLVNWDGESYLESEYHKLNPGQWTDDSQMQQILAESLIEYADFNPDDLAKRYVDWIYSGRSRGYGRTTKIAIDALKNGTHWSKSGVDGSLGNGTAMRAAPLGVYFRNDYNKIVECASIDAYMTHASAEAKVGSIAIALTTAFALNNDLQDHFERLAEYLPNSLIKYMLPQIKNLYFNRDILPAKALALIGTSANVTHTVPAVLYCFKKFLHFNEGIVTIIRAGGDTDTQASILGNLFGAQGHDIPQKWIDGVEDSEKIQKLDLQLIKH